MIQKFIIFLALTVLTCTSIVNYGFARNSKFPEISQLTEYYKNLTPENRKNIRVILQKYQNNIDFQYDLGTLYMQLNKPLNAELIFKKIFNDQPKDKYEIAYGQALLAQQKFQEIFQVVDKNSPIKHLKAYKYFLHAYAYYGLGRSEKSLPIINEALELLPQDTDMLIFKARVLTVLKQHKLSFKILDTIKGKSINTIELNQIKAENYILNKEYLKAREAYNKIILFTDNNFDAYAGRARVNLLMYNNEEALEDGMILLDKNQNHPMSFFVLASALNQQKRFKEAYNIYNKRSSQYPYFYEGVLLEAEIQVNNNNNNRAQILLNKYIKHDPENVKALNLLGILKLRAGNTYDAINFFKHAQSINDYDPYSIIALAYAHYKANNYTISEQYYRILEKKFPEFSYVSDDAHNLACKLPTVKKLNPAMCTHIKKEEINAQIFNALGQLHIGNFDKAQHDIKQLMHIYPSNMLLKKYYARILNFSGNPDKAVSVLFDMLTDKSIDYRQETLRELYHIYLSGKSTIDILNKLYTIFLDNPSSSDMGYHLANFFYQNKNYNQAINIVKIMIEQDTHNVALYKTAFKVMIKDPELFANEIKKYLNEYKKEYADTPTLITSLRKNIMRRNIKNDAFITLQYSFNEKEPEDYHVFAQYLTFLGFPKKAHIIHQKGLTQFKDNFDIYLNAFAFYQNRNEINMLTALVDNFQGKNTAQNNILKAKLLHFQGNQKSAIALLKQQFDKNKNGYIAETLLDFDKTDQTTDNILKNMGNIDENKYQLTIKLVDVMANKNDYTTSAHLLFPFYKTKIETIGFKHLLAKVSFYTDFAFGTRLIEQVIKQSPFDNQYLTTFIKFEAQNKDFKSAIALFEKIKPSIQDDPSVAFYYAYALFKVKKESEAMDILEVIVKLDKKFFEKVSASKLVDYINKKNGRS